MTSDCPTVQEEKIATLRCANGNHPVTAKLWHWCVKHYGGVREAAKAFYRAKQHEPEHLGKFLVAGCKPRPGYLQEPCSDELDKAAIVYEWCERFEDAITHKLYPDTQSV
jgi:hypothetical protein